MSIDITKPRLFGRGEQGCRRQKKCDFWKNGDLVGVISEPGCCASPDIDRLRNKWKQEDPLLELVVFKMINNSREDAFRGRSRPHVRVSHNSA